MIKPQITYVVPIICDAFIGRFIETLYKYSARDSFKLIVVDQTVEGSKNLNGTHLVLRPSRNLGYAKACNEGILHGLHWGTPLICVSNDDIEIINSQWMGGIYQTFDDFPKAVAVGPRSPKVAGWGYGVDGYPEIVPYKEEFNNEDYKYLLKGDFIDKDDILPPNMPRIQTGVEDGMAFVMPYFRRETFSMFGLLEERYWPGSGEDYDMNGRIYSHGYRCLSTTKSWVWHHWSSSKKYIQDVTHPYLQCRQPWNNIGDLWPPELNEGKNHDVYGHREDKDGNRIPLNRVPEIGVEQI